MPVREKIVAIRKDGGSFLLKGDGDDPDRSRQNILPQLLDQGWNIRTIHMTASAAVNDDQVLGLVVLSRA